MTQEQRINKVIESVTLYFNKKAEEIKKNTRAYPFPIMRSICSYFLRNEIKLPLQQISEALYESNDHTDVFHSINSLKEKMKTNREIKYAFEQISKSIEEKLYAES